ncbi:MULTISPECIES: hemin uptake protein HemP [unclassified Guyparkeria]|uniref:hemin uptake protein HemP n=1 Tax=unclassified Guyparkeria TaxID=2626246 RepID=UPI0009E73E6C|nr:MULTISPECIES: hemin uptake protein HemP [unclassified Guyparkeria]
MQQPQGESRPARPEPPTIVSERLLGPTGQIRIQHDGQWYLLRITASNKLILTK